MSELTEFEREAACGSAEVARQRNRLLLRLAPQVAVPSHEELEEMRREHPELDLACRTVDQVFASLDAIEKEVECPMAASCELACEGTCPCGQGFGTVLRHLCLCALLGNPELFRNNLLFWLQQIMTQQCSFQELRVMQASFLRLEESVNRRLPPEGRDFLQPFFRELACSVPD